MFRDQFAQSITYITTLISTSGTRFPRAVREPPRRLVPVGSPLDLLFPQESRTFRSNQLCVKRLNTFCLQTNNKGESEYSNPDDDFKGNQAHAEPCLILDYPSCFSL
jgi:hypothetical protein